MSKKKAKGPCKACLQAEIDIEHLEKKLAAAEAALASFTDWKPNVGMIPNKAPAHGSCCTCQRCGRCHDECVCNHNEIELMLQAAQAGGGV